VPRLLDAPDDTVLVDGKPVRDFKLDQLRGAIGFVPQETFLFSDTLAANIAFGVQAEPPASAGGEHSTNGQAEVTTIALPPAYAGGSAISIEKAAEVAGLADDVADFPNKYEQLVGERGITLSGGQKQRTAIARAVIKDAPILVLDDALSHVDTHTEEEILRRLHAFMAGRTAIVVAHRTSTIALADRIVVLERGEIIEAGSHDDLLARGGAYARFFRRQLLAEQLAEEGETA
jgi:ATP-binding cassette subfamily B protein